MKKARLLDNCSSLLALLRELFHHRLVALLVKGLQRLRRSAHCNPATLFLEPDTLLLKVWLKDAGCDVVSVRDRASVDRFLTGQFALTCHDAILQRSRRNNRLSSYRISKLGKKTHAANATSCANCKDWRVVVKTELLSAEKNGIERAAEILRRGGLVGFPTETVYGLGADALSAEAIASVFAAKGRPADNPLILHLSEIPQIDLYAHLNQPAVNLAERFMPGPFTLVLPSRAIVPSIARAGLSTVALRIPDHEIARTLIALAGPLVAPSANLSGRPSPTRAEHVIADLDGRIDAVLDGGACRVGLESTVVDLSGERPRLLRPGHIGREEVEEFLGVRLTIGGKEEQGAAPASPGMKYRHYAPNIPVELVEFDDENDEDVAGKLKIYFKSDDRLLLLVGPSLQRIVERSPENIESIGLSEERLYESFRMAESEGFARVIVVYRRGEISAALENRIAKAVSRV